MKTREKQRRKNRKVKSCNGNTSLFFHWVRKGSKLQRRVKEPVQQGSNLIDHENSYSLESCNGLCLCVHRLVRSKYVTNMCVVWWCWWWGHWGGRNAGECIIGGNRVVPCAGVIGVWCGHGSGAGQWKFFRTSSSFSRNLSKCKTLFEQTA